MICFEHDAGILNNFIGFYGCVAVCTFLDAFYIYMPDLLSSFYDLSNLHLICVIKLHSFRMILLLTGSS